MIYDNNGIGMFDDDCKFLLFVSSSSEKAEQLLDALR